MKKFTLKKTEQRAQKNYTIDYKAELNPQQYEAVTHLNGPQLIIAGAGSGKTRTLIFRVAYLVENNIDPHSILLLTFTRKSAQEMMRRAATILDDRCRRVAGGTFHSFANLILRKYALHIHMHPNFTIVDRGDAEDIVNIIRTELELHLKDRRFPRKSTLINIFSQAINKSTAIEDIVCDEYPNFEDDIDDIQRVAQRYKDFKREKMVMDYDDLLVHLRDLLRNNDEVRRTISNTYRYIMVDEYQDTNKVQADITLLLASEHKNVVVVGDDSQSIYSFRGADFRNIMDFPTLFPGARVTTLEQNYRSTRPILNLTNAIIQQAKEKFSKTLFSAIEGSDKPVYLDVKDENEQAEFIAQRVLVLREEGVPLSKIAVLFRASWHANALEVVLTNAHLPFVKYGGMRFAEAAHVKDILSYLRVLHNVFDEIAWLRMLALMDGIGPATATKITAAIIGSGGDIGQLIGALFAKKKYFPLLFKLHQMLSRLSGSRLTPAEQLETAIDFYLPIFEVTYDDYRRRREDLSSLLRISERYTSLEQMLTDMALEPPDTMQKDTDATDQEDEKMVLSTIHSAKGLEWHTVFLIHLVEGYFPSFRSLNSESQIEEERRLFYVAATRAQKNLYLLKPELEKSSWQSYDMPGMIFSEPSRFLSEIPNIEELTEVGVIETDDSDPF